MSAALSAAKKRRAPTSIQPETPRMGGSSVGGEGSMQSTQGMTLPQVIALIDKRLIQLELFSKNIQGTVKAGVGAAATTAAPAVDKDEIVNAVVEEFQSRFDVMAEEIAEMKQIVMHLQSYTMDVNKMLLSQLQQTGVFTFSTSENNTSGSDEGEEIV